MIATETQLLEIWERGYNALPIERAMLLATVACPELSFDQAMDLPIGLRDSRLLRLRSSLFGSSVTSTANCPNCASRLELSFDLRPLVDLSNGISTSSFPVSWQELELEFRCPNTRDILEVGRLPEEKRELAMLSRCSLSDVPMMSSSMDTSSLIESVASKVEQVDPLAEIEYTMNCVDCGNQFHTTFDIVSFLWAEINAWCQRLMGDIHLIAKVYGWTEAEILKLSSWRRQVYLNMIRQ